AARSKPVMRRARPLAVALLALAIAAALVAASSDARAPRGGGGQDGSEVVVSAARAGFGGHAHYTLLAFVRRRAARHLCTKLVERFRVRIVPPLPTRLVVSRSSSCLPSGDLPPLAVT